MRGKVRSWNGRSSPKLSIAAVVCCARKRFCSLLSSIFLSLLGSSALHAQTAAPLIPGPQVFATKAEPLIDTAAREGGDPRPKSADGALPVFDWLIFGSAALGAAYDSNVNSSPTSPIAAYGPRFQPTIIAERNTGIQRTLIYGVGDIRYYPSVGITQVYDTTAGIVHLWEIQRDFLFRTQGQVTRGEDALGLTNVAGNILVPIDPIKSTRLYGSASLEKGFGLVFTGFGGSITRENFEDTHTSTGIDVNESFRDGSIATVNGRLGFHISPIIYSFVEPSANWARHNAANLDSEGYRIIAGLGSARIGLMNGEIYGG